MSIGLIALLDDVAGLAKVAAASLDDAAGQAARAGVKAAGVVIDDTAVSPTYVMGFDASRELPIVGRIALGSAKNKLLYLLPAALLLSAVAPWAVTPLLMIGGLYLCFEGAEKVVSMVGGHAGPGGGEAVGGGSAHEDAKVRSAVQTDFILSAEIMAVTLGSVTEAPLWEQALVLAIVGLGITGAVYGVVALIVKADDVGVWMARRSSAPVRVVGRALVLGMPVLMRVLSGVGTAAMIWVGGGILVHGLAAFGWGGPAHWVEAGSHAASVAVAGLGGLAGWAAGAALSGVFGLVVGAALVPVVSRGIVPVLGRVRGWKQERRAG